MPWGGATNPYTFGIGMHTVDRLYGSHSWDFGATRAPSVSGFAKIEGAHTIAAGKAYGRLFVWLGAEGGVLLPSGMHTTKYICRRRNNGELIVDGSITANKISVGSLQSVSATIGTLRTATSGGRTEIMDNKIYVYDASNVLRVKMGYLL